MYHVTASGDSYRNRPADISGYGESLFCAVANMLHSWAYIFGQDPEAECPVTLGVVLDATHDALQQIAIGETIGVGELQGWTVEIKKV